MPKPSELFEEENSSLRKTFNNCMSNKQPKKWDYETDDKEIGRAMTKMEQVLIKKVGMPCKRQAVGCWTCRMWANFDAFKMNFF